MPPTSTVTAPPTAAPADLTDVIEVCPPRRQAVKSALRSLLAKSQRERAEIGRRARQVARSIFDWEVLVDRYLQLYDDVLGK